MLSTYVVEKRILIHPHNILKILCITTRQLFKTFKRFNIPFRSRTVGRTTSNKRTDYKLSKLYVEILTLLMLRSEVTVTEVYYSAHV